MEFLERLKRFYKKHREPLLYLIVGGLTTVVSFATQWLFSDLLKITPVFLATVLSLLCAITFAFFLDKFIVFKSASLEPKVFFKEAGLFYGMRSISAVFESVGMGLLCDVYGESILNALISSGINVKEKYYIYIAKGFLNIFIIVMNYIFSKFFIFTKDKEKAA